MNPMQVQVKAFHDTFGLNDVSSPQIPSAAVQRLRMRLIYEEAQEFAQASAAGDLPHAIKELADLFYVVLGAANAYGVDIEPFFDEVHRSNMTKHWPDGEVRRDADGKILKPPTYSPANIERILEAVISKQ